MSNDLVADESQKAWQSNFRRLCPLGGVWRISGLGLYVLSTCVLASSMYVKSARIDDASRSRLVRSRVKRNRTPCVVEVIANDSVCRHSDNVDEDRRWL